MHGFQLTCALPGHRSWPYGQRSGLFSNKETGIFNDYALTRKYASTTGSDMHNITVRRNGATFAQPSYFKRPPDASQASATPAHSASRLRRPNCRILHFGCCLELDH
jgi:hypothetical protein